MPSTRYYAVVGHRFLPQAQTHPIRHLTSRSEPAQPCPHKNPPRHSRQPHYRQSIPISSQAFKMPVSTLWWSLYELLYLLYCRSFFPPAFWEIFVKVVADYFFFFLYRATRVSAPSRSLPKPRSRTVLSPSGFVWGPVTPSSKYTLFHWFFFGDFKGRSDTATPPIQVFFFDSILQKEERKPIDSNETIQSEWEGYKCKE